MKFKKLRNGAFLHYSYYCSKNVHFILRFINVVFIHAVNKNLLAKLYENALANIYISLYEGFGLPPLEAASVGTVSWVADIPIMYEVLGEPAIFVNPTSEEDIVRKIQDIYLGNINLEAIREIFPSLLSNYSWQITAEKIAKLIKK